MLTVALERLCWHCSDPVLGGDEPGTCGVVPEHAECCEQARHAAPDDFPQAEHVDVGRWPLRVI